MTITWKNSDLKGKRFDFEIGNQFLGTLTLLNEFGSKANFNTTKDKIQYGQFGIFNNKVLLRKNDNFIGQIKNRLLSESILNLETGKKYFLSSNIVGRNLIWKDTRGFPVVEYSMALRKTKGKGSIKISSSLTIDDKEILTSAGLIAGRLKANRFAFILLLLASLLTMIGKFI